MPSCSRTAQRADPGRALGSGTSRAWYLDWWRVASPQVCWRQQHRGGDFLFAAGPGPSLIRGLLWLLKITGPRAGPLQQAKVSGPVRPRGAELRRNGHVQLFAAIAPVRLRLYEALVSRSCSGGPARRRGLARGASQQPCWPCRPCWPCWAGERAQAQALQEPRRGPCPSEGRAITALAVHRPVSC